MTATFVTAHAAYLDNADYDVENSLTKARLFATACRRLIALTTTGSAKGGNSIEDDVRKYERGLHEAKVFIATHPDGDGYPVRHPDFSNLRS